jgi:hypothetical protein
MRRLTDEPARTPEHHGDHDQQEHHWLSPVSFITMDGARRVRHSR